MVHKEKINKVLLKQLIEQEKYKTKDSLPRKVRIEACSLCQLSCPSCFMRIYHEKVDKTCKLGYLSFKNFKKFVDNNTIEEIELTRGGELFLNPELDKIICYADKKGIKLTAYAGVNLNYLSNEMAETLVRCNFVALKIALDGASQETYSIYRKHGSFDKVIANIKKINHFKKQYNSEFPKLIWKFIVFGHNEHEILLAKELAKQYNMDITFDISWDKNFSPIKNTEFIMENTDILTMDGRGEAHIQRYEEDKDAWFYCKELWTAPQINWDGSLLGCCMNSFEDFGGNVFKDGYLKAMNNNKLCMAKNILKGEIPPIMGIPCSLCWIYKKLEEKNLKVNL